MGAAQYGKVAGVTTVLAMLASAPSHAAEWTVTYDGWVGGYGLTDTIVQRGTGTTLQSFGPTTPTQFVFQAQFDDSSPNVANAGFAAYAAKNATLTIDGVRYGVTGYDSGTKSGVYVALFDATNSASFGYPPGHFAGGFINVVNGSDGAGVVGDWLPTNDYHFTDSLALTNALFSQGDFYGVGYNPGAIELTLSGGGLADLNLLEDGNPGGNIQGAQTYYTNCSQPVTIGGTCINPAVGYPPQGQTATDLQGQLILPEPATITVLGAGLAALGLIRRRRPSQPAASSAWPRSARISSMCSRPIDSRT